MSSHVDFDSQQVPNYLTANNLGPYKYAAGPAGDKFLMKQCPFCHDDKGHHSNQWKLAVYTTGGYNCVRCGSSGSWLDFKKEIGGYEATSTNSTTSTTTTATCASSNGPRAAADKYKSSGNNSRYNGNFSSNGNGNGNGNNSASQEQPPLPSPKSGINTTYMTSLDSNPFLPLKKSIMSTRGLTSAVLKKYGVGTAKFSFPSKDNTYRSHDCITFPWFLNPADLIDQESRRGCTLAAKDLPKLPDGKPVGHVLRRIKARSLEEKSMQRLDPAGGGWGLFGYHTIPADATTVVLTEGEYDAMAVYQATGLPAISLPNGCRSLPPDCLPLLEKFTKIYLWMDNDGPGQEGSEVFSKKLGVSRCWIVRPPLKNPNARPVSMQALSSPNEDSIAAHLDPSTLTDDTPAVDETPPKDANEALLRNYDLQAIIDAALPIPHDNVVTFATLREQVMHELLNPMEYCGVPTPSLPSLTNILKGFRRGEMTVITGPTGSGKTTFLSQISLDFAEQHVNTLWGSFEVKNTKLLHKMLHQFSRNPIVDKSMSELDALADRFEDLPLHFLKFHGGSQIQEIVDAMEFAVYVHDVQHIILDNLQFMMESPGKGFDKYDMQDRAIETFRKFATTHNVHVSLVVHPRKEDEGIKLGINSIFGSAKATQEADNVLILQNDGRRKYIEVKKNRYDGSLGFFPLHFQHRSARYSESPDEASKSAGAAMQSMAPASGIANLAGSAFASAGGALPAGGMMTAKAGHGSESPYILRKREMEGRAYSARPTAAGRGWDAGGWESTEQESKKESPFEVAERKARATRKK